MSGSRFGKIRHLRQLADVQKAIVENKADLAQGRLCSQPVKLRGKIFGETEIIAGAALSKALPSRGVLLSLSFPIKGRFRFNSGRRCRLPAHLMKSMQAGSHH